MKLVEDKKKLLFFFEFDISYHFHQLFYLIIKYKNSILFDEGIPIDENVTIEDFFATFAIDTLEPEFWNINFEAYLRKMKFGNKEKDVNFMKHQKYMIFL